ncbi:MAG: FAD-binding oxidoreductase [Solirubrobacterales bacterium]|nr:FAD-binding oxidoreductase [Solirubrobacterales bacterium]
MATVEQTTSAAQLQGLLHGTYLDPKAPGYDGARALYNAMIDKRPAAIVRCADAADVIATLGYAREHDLRVAVRGGGHNGAGLGSVDDGLVIDLSPMHGVIVDPADKVVRVQGGATLAAVDHATHAFGLAVPGGIISTTGIGGLTLGGGLGHITRRCGLTIDNLLSADVVLADGTCLTASAERNEDLFWALRGGGGNFGIVTSFTFRCHEVANVIAGPVLYDLDHAAELLSWWREFGPAQPDELSGFFAFLSVPPGPPFPEELHLRKVCGVLWCYCGGEADPACLREARGFGSPLLDGVQPMPLPALQSAFDGVYPPGDQWYWRGNFVSELPDAAIERHVEHGAAMPTWKSTMHLYAIDGAASKVGADETPWAYRDAKWAQVIVGVDPEPANADAIRQWCVDYWEATHPYSMGGAYVNFMMEEGQERVQATYRGNYARLAEIKAKYDPDNFFRVNQNIRPA